jgi:para-nitrobenzyl esterase
MRRWARATIDAGSTAYLYYFSHVPPSPRAKELGAFHAGEIPYVFNVVPSADPREAGFLYTDTDRALAEAMSSYWVNFVKSGNPNAAGLPAWPAYERGVEAYLEFAERIRTGNRLLATELDALDPVLSPSR